MMNMSPAPWTPTRMLVLLISASCSENLIWDVSTTWGNERRGYASRDEIRVRIAGKGWGEVRLSDDYREWVR
jgi:hypothetical protein